MQITNTPLRSANADRSTHIQASCSTRLRCALRRIIMLGALLGSIIPAMAQTQYVFMRNNANNIYYANGTTWSNSTTFNKSYVWTLENGVPKNNGRYLIISRSESSGWIITNYSYAASLSTSRNTTYTFSISNGNPIATSQNASNWGGNTTYYLPYNSFNLSNNTGENDRVIAYQVNSLNAENPTLSISANPVIISNGIKLTPSITGTYAPACNSVTLGSNTYYWTNTTEASTSRPGEISDWSDATVTWVVTTGGTYASVNSDGLVTITGNPTGNIVVRMTVTKGGFTTNNTTTITLTRAAVSQNTNTTTTITGPTISPTSAALYYNDGSQAFTASASATTATVNTPAHTTLTGGGNTYYYYNSTLYSSTDGFSTSTETHPAVTLNWALSGAAASYLTRTPATGTSTTVTHSTQSPSDLTATLTVTASATGATNTTATATITAYGPIVAPTITCSGKTVSMSTTSANATIYYTTDGSTPTASSTQYTGPFDLTTSPTPIKAIAIRDGRSSTVTTETFKIKLPTPVITISNTGLATIALGEGSPAGTTIHYTTDGTTPTAESTTYSSAVQLTNPQTIRAIAVKDGYDDSDVAAGDYVSQGTTTSQVIIDDREDHSWAYYNKELGSPIRSWNPADVKITYNGNGTTNVSESNDANPANNSWTKKAENVKVSNATGEGQSTFIYLKTLERTDGQTADNPSGRCAYTMIPNPFSVRPTYGSGDTRWRGFYKWRITSIKNGKIYTAATGGTEKTAYSSGNLADANVLDADVTYYFEPTGEYGMEVVLEALWARAYVVAASENGENAVTNQNVGYERNFVVLSSKHTYKLGGNGRRITNSNNRAFTITSTNPDGSTPNNRGTFGDADASLTADTKIENVAISMGDNTLTAAGHDLIVGRGCSGTINYVRGVNANVTSPNYTIRIESGTINYLSFIRGYSTTEGTATDVPGNNQTYTVGGTPNIKGVLGCDYDRATNSGITNNLIINNGVYYGYSVSEANGIVYSDNALNVHVKSGKIGNSFTINNSYTADAQQAFYIGVAGQRVRGHRKLFLEGGEVASIAGGIDATTNQNNNSVTFRMTGGHVRGAVYGGAARSAAYGNRNLIVTGGNITGWIGGGCNGEAYPAGQTSEDTYGGITNGAARVYFGGDATCGGTGSNVNINGSQGGIVFGAGKGVEGNTTSGRMSQGTTVVVADECDIERNVYGGGNFGYAQTSTNVFVSGGTVHGNVFGGSNQNNGPDITITTKGNGTIEGGLYGGSNASGNVASVTMNISGSTMEGGVYGGGYGTNSVSCDVTGAVNITMNVGTVLTGLYGGGNVNSKVSGVTTINVNGGTIGASDNRADVHGGGLGSLTRIRNSVVVNIGAQNATSGATIYGDVYGGSAEGKTNGNTARENNATTAVTLNAGTINGSLYGGGLGTQANAADVYGPVTVVVNGGSVTKPDGNPGSIFGCNNVNGSPKNTVTVTINGTDPTTYDGQSNKIYAINGVYGGGNQAHYDYDNASYPTVTINGCESSIKDVYGGGNAAAVPSTHVTINGGDIYRVFGGGNGESGTPAHVGYKNIIENNTGSPYSANGNVSVDINGGNIYQVFGGSNAHGTIKGDISVDVEKNSTCPIQIGALFSGGNKAASKLGTITVGCMDTADKIDSLFCGANQADVTGSVDFTMKGGRINNLFGGNNQSGNVSGSIKVTVDWSQGSCSNNYLGNVFGGGNLATFGTEQDTKAPTVNIYHGTVSGNVYGGGKGDPNDHTKGQVTGNPIVTIGDDNANHQATISGSVFGGGDAGNVVGTPVVNVAEKCNTVITTAVYGGGNAADVTGTNVTINGGTIGDVFGGGNGAVAAANVTGATSLTIHGGTITRVFAGGNTAGTIGTNSGVTIDHSSSCDQSIAEVYGGGNLAAGNAGTVTIQCSAENIGDVYGGANQANVTNDITLNITGGQINNVFGGNNTSGSISGGITVNINKDASCNTFSVNNVYGGGNLAQYAIPDGKALAVNILNGTVSQNVYGGGKGLASDHTKGQVTGNPVVTIGDANNLNNDNIVATVTGDVYGGGDAGNVVGTPVVNVINKCNTTIGNVYGGGNAADVSGTDVNIDGGNITGMVFGGGHGNKNATPNPVAANVGGNVNVDITGGTINKVFGGSNSKGNITGTVTVNINKDDNSCDMHITEVYGGGNEAAGNAGTLTIGCTGDFDNKGEGIGDVYGGANAADINNGISLTIRGGHINNVFGGNNTSGSISGTIAVEINWNDDLTCGKYLGNVFGGGNLAAYTGSPTVTLTNGTVSHSVFGGGNEAGVGGSTVNINGGQVFDGVYGGCNTSGDVSGNIIVNINGGTLGVSGTPLTSGIFGGGFGSATTTGGNVTVNVGDASAASAAATPTIWGDIYGGSALGTVNDAVADQTTVNINNGTIHGNIYGGGLGAATLNDKGYIASITTQAIVNGTVHVNIGTEQQNSNFVTVDGQVFGCNNLAGTPKGNVYVDVYHTAHTTANTYPATEPAKATDVTELAPTAFAIAAVYGGGNLADYTTTTENAATHVHIHNCDNTIEYVYGGGNAASSPATDVIIDGGRFNYIFGGGNGKGDGNPGADIEGDAAATLNGGIIYRAFGGSNTKGNIGGTSTVDLPQTTTCTRLVKELFGGGNEAPGGSVDMVIPCGTTGTGIIYAGANNADMGTEAAFNAGNPVTIKLTVEGGDFTQVFGGNNQGGTIWGNVELYIKGGTIGQAFGGNNLGGNIKGSIKVFVIEDETSCPLVLTDVYGGGYNAAYTPADPTITSPQVYIFHKKAGTAITGNVFGGGLGATAIVTANPKVIIGDYNANHSVTINGDVYGGGDAGNVVGTPSVIVVNKCNTSIANVYGGGNAANVNGTIVKIEGGTITNDVFGGGHGDKASLNQGEDTSHSNKTANVNGNTSVTITGGTINRVFAGSNINGTITGTNNELIINKSDTAKCDLKIAEVYGGGNQAAGNATTITIGKTGTWTTDDNDDDDNNNFHNKHNTTDNRIGYELEGIGTVYGGANAADIGTSQNSSNITLSINNGIVNKVFGGNNSSGDIYGTITVNINMTSNLDNQWHIGNVYGGGNLAAYSHSGTDYPAVNIQNGTVSGSVFGGGFGTTAVVTANPHVTVSGGTITGDVFGGGEEAGVTGNSTVLMTGGQVTNVYGGGMQANVDGDNTVSIEGGSVTYDVYGGGMQGDVTGNVTVNISKSGTPGTVSIGRDVYGGGALANTNTANRSLNAQNEEVIDLSNTSKKTIVNLYPGATIGHDVYGGGRGQKADNTTQPVTNAVEAVVYGNVTVYQMGAILTAAYSDEGLATGGRIFGGNNINGTPKGHIKVHVSKTTGTTGQQRSSDEARASATATHTYELAAVYGGGNQAEYNPYEDDPDDPEGFAEVEIDGCNDVSIHSVYGGGNAASTPATLVTIGGAYEIEYVFGGGNGAGRNNPGANVGYHDYGNDHAGISQEDVNYRLNSDYKYGTGVAKTNIYGGRIHNIYGGSNTRGNVRETAVAMLDEVNTCPLVVDGIYGGGREAYMEGGTSIELGCVTGLDEIYGGSEKADVGSSVELTITSGHFGRVFGGNNKSGRIYGSITVDIEQTGCVPITIDELYLGGNNAPYSVYGYEDSYTEHNVGTEQAPETVKHYNLKTSGNKYPDPVLNIRSFKSIGTVYGGGKGVYATMVGDPTVDINVTHGWVNGEYVGTVTELSQYKGAPAQLTEDGVIGTVFGGGNAATVDGSPKVKIGDKLDTSVELKSMRNLFESFGDQQNIEHEDIRITKDGTTGVTYTNKTDGTKTLTEAISQTVNGATITGNVYGGGNAADVTGNTEIQIGPTQTSGGGQPSPAPQRTEQPAAQTDQPAAPAQTQPASQTQNAATEAPQGRAVTPTRQ